MARFLWGLNAVQDWLETPQPNSPLEVACLLWPQRGAHIGHPALILDDQIERLQRRVQSATPERMMRELASAVETLATSHPLLIVLEALHWSDVATLDWLAYMARRRQSARLLVICTYRTSDIATQDHPVHAVMRDLLLHQVYTELAISNLSPSSITDYLTQRFGTSLWSEGLIPILHQRTNDNPLFLANVIEGLIRQGESWKDAAGWHFADIKSMTLGTPKNLRHLIDEQLDQPAEADQELLEAASVAGSVFAAAAIEPVMSDSIEAIEKRCETLVRQGQVLRTLGPTD